MGVASFQVGEGWGSVAILTFGVVAGRLIIATLIRQVMELAGVSASIIGDAGVG